MEYLINSNYNNFIAHNLNDTYVEHDYTIDNKYYDETGIIRKYYTKKIYSRDIIIYDDLNRIINLEELRLGLEKYQYQISNTSRIDYKKRSRRYRTYQLLRYDPVPFTGNGRRYGYSRSSRHTYRNDYINNNNEDFNDPILTIEISYRSNWEYDDYYLSRSCYSKSWKDQSKKKKQWM